MIRRHLCTVFVCLSLAACQTSPLAPRARLDDEGGAYVYLQALPQEAARLRFVLEGIAATTEAGREVALSVALREVTADSAGRQRLLAAGPLPPGDYGGFLVRTSAAGLRGGARESALLVPDTPTRVDFRFTVRRRETVVVALALRYGASVEAGFRFTPAFAVFAPERPAAGLMGFVSNAGSNDVTVFNRKSLQVFDVIATGRRPRGLAVDPRGRRLYVATSGDDEIEIVDVLAGRVGDRIRLASGDEPWALALTPDGRTLLSANRASNTVSLVDTGSRSETAKLPVGGGPRSVVIDHTGRTGFVLNGLSNSVTVIDIPARSVVRTILIDPGPLQAALNRRGDGLYVVHDLVPYVTLVNPRTFAVARRFPLRTPAGTIAVDPSTDLVYLGSGRDLVVGLHDPVSFGPVDFVDAGAGVVHLAVDVEEQTLYLVSATTNRVLVSHRVRRRVVGEIDVGGEPAWIGLMGAS